MAFDAHGHYDIEIRGEVFIARFYQTWNLEGVKCFFEEYKSLVHKKSFKKFGVLSDLRLFEGGPPDVLGYFEEMAEWAKTHGQIARAQLSGSDLISHMIHQASEDKTLFSIKTFNDETQALAWLSDQGLDIG